MRGPIVTIPVVVSPSSHKHNLDFDGSEEEEEEEEEIKVERFHHACFRCGNCGDSFGELDGKANFVREHGRPVHISVSP